MKNIFLALMFSLSVISCTNDNTDGEINISDLILGQSSERVSANNQYAITYPQAVHFIGSKFYALSGDENRILVWNSAPTASATSPNSAIGQSSIYTTGFQPGGLGAKSYNYPSGFASNGTKFAVADRYNNRVLLYNSIPSGISDAADVVLGQPDFTSTTANNGGIGANTLSGPRSIAITSGGKLLVVDHGNHRVLIWNSWPTSNQQSADLVLGQPNMTSNTANNGGISASTLNLWSSFNSGIYTDGTKIYVSDNSNNRVLGWTAWPTTNGEAADFVLGQPNMTSSTANNGGIGAGTLYRPSGITSDGTRLFVADTWNQRVLIWNALPTTDQAVANVALGQANMTGNTSGQGASNFFRPISVAVSGTKLAVAEFNNHRVMLWNAIPTSDGTAADLVLGQNDFGENGFFGDELVQSASTLHEPYDVATNGEKIFVVDTFNNRILGWSSFPEVNKASADIVLGQPDFTSNTANNGGVTADSISNPYSIEVVGTKLVSVEFSNSRVKIWNTLPTASGQSPDIVLGQPDFTSNTGNNGGRSAQSLRYPSGACSDGTKLYVVDYYNHRVLVWNTFPTTTQQAADYVLGQADMTSATANSGGVSKSSLNFPYDCTAKSGFLAVTDQGNHRVLIWNSSITADNQSADIVIGQPDAVSSTANNGGISASTMNAPKRVHVDGDKFYVMDGGNIRILAYNSIPSSDAEAADAVVGQSSFTSYGSASGLSALNVGGYLGSFGGIATTTDKFIFADNGNHRVVFLPKTLLSDE